MSAVRRASAFSHRSNNPPAANTASIGSTGRRNRGLPYKTSDNTSKNAGGIASNQSSQPLVLTTHSPYNANGNVNAYRKLKTPSRPKISQSNGLTKYRNFKTSNLGNSAGRSKIRLIVASVSSRRGNQVGGLPRRFTFQRRNFALMQVPGHLRKGDRVLRVN